MKILITSGGTKVAIDRVRHIANMSSGTFGAKIATETLKAGHEVIFLKAKGSKSPFTLNVDLAVGYNKDNMHEWYAKSMDQISKLYSYIPLLKNYSEVIYTDYNSYAASLEKIIREQSPDIVVLAAAVSDYGVKNYIDGKIRSNQFDGATIQLEELPKLISKVKEWARNCKLIGFKLLVDSNKDELFEAAMKSIRNNKCDLVVANDLRDIKSDNHKLLLVLPDGKSMQYWASDKKSDPNYLAGIVVKTFLS